MISGVDAYIDPKSNEKINLIFTNVNGYGIKFINIDLIKKFIWYVFYDHIQGNFCWKNQKLRM